ncbi:MULTISPECIES: hypothetical protein [Serratia]|uniref:hypothetical protein n=1 Tax=Serratia TaxID=613 RepID=UPI000A3EAB43|nr:hypothetical protein [Serratia sp. 506_PEND]
MNNDACFFMRKAFFHDGTVGCKKRPIMDIDLIVALRYRVKLLPSSPNKKEVMKKFDEVLMSYLDGTSFEIPELEGELISLLLRMRLHQRRLGSSVDILGEISDVIARLNAEIEHVYFWCCKIAGTISTMSMIYPLIKNALLMLFVLLLVIVVLVYIAPVSGVLRAAILS